MLSLYSIYLFHIEAVMENAEDKSVSECPAKSIIEEKSKLLHLVQNGSNTDYTTIVPRMKSSRN